MNKELIQLINDNPDLPIYAWVNGDVCQDDGCYWLGKFTNANIREYAIVPYDYGCYGTDWVFKDDQEDCIDYLVENVYVDEHLSVDDAEKKAQEYLDNLKYNKGIFVYVDLP